MEGTSHHQMEGDFDSQTGQKTQGTVAEGGPPHPDKPCRIRVPSLVTILWLLPSPNGLAHEVKFLGVMGGAMSLLIDYSRFEMLYKGLLKSLH